METTDKVADKVEVPLTPCEQEMGAKMLSTLGWSMLLAIPTLIVGAVVGYRGGSKKLALQILRDLPRSQRPPRSKESP